MRTIVPAAFILLLILQLATAAAIEEAPDTIFGSQELKISVGLSSSFEIVPEGSDYSISYVDVNLTLFPKDTGSQKVSFTKLQPKPTITGDSMLFRWDSPPAAKLSFSAVSEVTTNHDFVHVTRKVDFQLSGLPDEVKRYTASSLNIDSDNREIIELASSLAAGEDDQFVVVYRLAEWANRNIQYNLSTLTADVSRPASWVLENRQGVCDEFTNLFIALNRALGIPARFVSGISYTDSELFPERWGFHGWAEVYFPGFGWVPFDVTYGEFGFVDPGHIYLQNSVDVTDTTTNYAWSGRNIELVASGLDSEVTLTSASGKLEPDFTMSSRVLKSNAGFGSYNLEEVEITNLKGYYVVAELVHSNTEGLELLDGNKRDALLRPNEKRLEYFAFRVSQSLDSSYRYTFPLSVKSYIVSAAASFRASSSDPVFSLGELETLKLQRDEEKVYSRNMDFSCESGKKEIYIYETVNITCTAANTGNVALNNLYFCHDNDCESFSLGITRSREFSVATGFSSRGTNRAQLSISSDTVSKSVFAEVNVLDLPSIAFESINHPETVGYNDRFELEFTAGKNSTSVPLDVAIRILPTSAVFDFNDLKTDRALSAELRAINLNDGKNTLTITADFRDGNNRAYTQQKEVIIGVKETNLLQKAIRFFIRIFS